MTHYLLTIYQPDGDGPPPPEVVDLDQVMRDVEALKDDMEAAGAWVFSGGLFPAGSSTVVRVDNGRALVTDGPYIEGKEHVGGFTVIQAPDLDAALGWAGKMARALSIDGGTTSIPVEVRPIADGHEA
jgi:hypothetical protein